MLSARTGLIIQEFTLLLEALFARHKSLTPQDTLRALEYLRYVITEQALKRSHPQFMRDDPADKKRKPNA